jgi:hypothetical protein
VGLRANQIEESFCDNEILCEKIIGWEILSCGVIAWFAGEIILYGNEEKYFKSIMLPRFEQPPFDIARDHFISCKAGPAHKISNQHARLNKLKQYITGDPIQGL